MHIAVLSDTHLRKGKSLPSFVWEHISQVDVILHAGDLTHIGVLEELSCIAPVRAVRGNCDGWDVSLPDHDIIECGTLNIGLIHGNTGKGKNTPDRAYSSFADSAVNIIVFGHSHSPYLEWRNGILLFNPGSPTDKRREQYFSFGLMDNSARAGPSQASLLLNPEEIMKHRRNKVKREHGIIQNALLWLESLSRLAEVTDIIPGVIDVSRSSERGIVYKYETQTGCKLLLKSNGSIQEAFVVTKHPGRVREWVDTEFPPDLPPTIAKSIYPNDSYETKKKILKISTKPAVELEYKPSIPRRQSKKQKRSKAVPSYFKDDDALNVADRLDSSTLKALKQFEKSLETVKTENLNAKDKRKS